MKPHIMAILIFSKHKYIGYVSVKPLIPDSHLFTLHHFIPLSLALTDNFKVSIMK